MSIDMWWLLVPVMIYSVTMLTLWVILTRHRRRSHRRGHSVISDGNHTDNEDIRAGDRETTVTAGERTLPAVSVVVAARNEADRISPLLNCLIQQEYPHELYEVIIVNDNSADQTAAVVKEFIDRENSPMPVLLTDSPFRGKKGATGHGVANATGEVIITTDADCRVSGQWVRSHAEWYSTTRMEVPPGGDLPPVKAAGGETEYTIEKEPTSYSDLPPVKAPGGETEYTIEKEPPSMVVAPVFQPAGKGFWYNFGLYEFAALQAVTGATAVAGHPVMGSAASISFRRDSYLQHAGRLRHDLPSGDDMFLLHAIKQSGGTICYDDRTAAAAETAAAATLRQLVRQRARWASKTLCYRDPATVALAAVTAATGAAVAAAAVAACITVHYIPLAVTLYTLKTLPDWLLVSGEMRRRGGKALPLTFLLSALIYPFYLTATAIISQLPQARQPEWWQ